MPSSFWKCKKDTKDVDTKMLRTKNDKEMLSSKCTACEESRILKKTRRKRIIKWFRNQNTIETAFF